MELLNGLLDKFGGLKSAATILLEPKALLVAPK